MKAPHLPFSCKFNDDKTLASYANGIYHYYDVGQIEEFDALRVLMKLNLCLKSLKILMIQFIDLKILLSLNIAMIIINLITTFDVFIEKVSTVQEETNILQKSTEEGIDETVSSLDEKDDEESED